MPITTGTLAFKGWLNRPWALAADDGEVHDLWPSVEAVLLSLHKRPAAHGDKMRGYWLKADPASEFDLEYEPETNPLLVRRGGFGFSNAGLSLTHALQRVNGQRVTIDTSADGIEIVADLAQAVPEVRYFGEGNMCRLPPSEDAKSICRPGTADCCVFLAVGASGFECLKFTGSTAGALLDRLARRDIRATRIGNCALVGREPEIKAA